MNVSLREITAETVRRITDLAVHESQLRFVATNAISLAEALFSAEAWYRAIYLDEEPVGFLMLYDETLRKNPPEKPEAFLWRFMIDVRFQRAGIGRRALALLVQHVRERGAYSTLLTSCVPGEGGPEPFYLEAGFRRTGEVEDGEDVLALALDS